MNTVSGATDWVIEEAFEMSGAYHMQRDESLALERVKETNLPNVLRLYSWQPAALSLGYQQSIDTVDLAACQERGIDVVRRPTGGRAVLHKNELTYAVIWTVPFEIGINASHNLIVEMLVRSLSSLGISSPSSSSPRSSSLRSSSLELSDPRASIKEEYQSGSLSNAACFLSTSRHEVTFDGKKTIGSAQRRFGNVLLQHGSILLNREHLLLPDLLAMGQDRRARMRELLSTQTSDLSQVFGRNISIREAANSVAATFIDHICMAVEQRMTHA